MKTIYSFLSLFLATFSVNAQSTCATPTTITAGTYTVDTIIGEAPTVNCNQTANTQTAGEWFVYTPTQDYTVTVSTDLPQNAGDDTRFHVYTGTCGNLVCHAGDDDDGSVYLSIDEFPVYANQTYYIVFDNLWDADTFDFVLSEGPFVEPAAGKVTFTSTTIGSINGQYKICVVDMNGDYLDDIVSVDGDNLQVHYQQSTGFFSDTTFVVPNVQFAPGWSMAAGDLDKNGFNDLVYGNGVGVSFINASADGLSYSETSTSEYVFSQRTNYIDLNNDGHLDVFVCHDVDPNVYYINDGNGNLTFYQGGIGDHDQGGNYGSIWTDYDNDGDMDLFIAKCRGGESTAKLNELHRNDGNGNFTDVSVASGMQDAIQTWSAAWNDFDNDGDMDAVVGASSSADGWHKVMINNNDGTFTDQTAGSGWDGNTTLSREYKSYDFDNDGYADVLGGAGRIMYGKGDMTFSSMDYNFSHGPIGDLNNDGFLDIQNGNTIYFNDGNENNWIKFNLQGTQSNGNGIGARITIYGEWGQQIREIRSGTGFAQMSSLNAHFGIGQATEIDSVYIEWPSGEVDGIVNPDINSTVEVIEGNHPLGLMNVDFTSVSIFPNPTSDFISIENFEELSLNRISIYSFEGKFIQEITSEKTDVRDLATGKYIIKIENNQGIIGSSSFVKK